VIAGAHGNFEFILTSEVDTSQHILFVAALRYDGGVLIGSACFAGKVVFCIRWNDNAPAKCILELADCSFASGLDFAAANARVLPSRATTAIEAAVSLMNSRRVFIVPLRVAIWYCTHSDQEQAQADADRVGVFPAVSTPTDRAAIFQMMQRSSRSATRSRLRG